MPQGIENNVEGHKNRLFEQAHQQGRLFEYTGRILRYAAEIVVYYGRGDKKQSRREINQLHRHLIVLNMITCRAWMGLNGPRLYRRPEIVELRKIVVYARTVRDKMKEAVDKLLADEMPAEGEDQAELSPRVLYVTDLLGCLDTLIFDLEMEAGWLPPHKEATWEDLALDVQTTDYIEGHVRKAPVQADPDALEEVPTHRLSQKQVAAMLGLTPFYLKQMRHYGTGPTYTKQRSGRGYFEEIVTYDLEDVISWIMTKPETVKKVVRRGAPLSGMLLDRGLVDNVGRVR